MGLGLQNEGLLGNDPRNPTFISRWTADTGAISLGDSISIDIDDTTNGLGNSATESDPATDTEDANTAVGLLSVAVAANSVGQMLSIQTGGYFASANVEATVKKGDLLMPGSTKGRLARFQKTYEKLVTGAIAGNVTGVTGINVDDVLVAVYLEDSTSGKWTELTSQFTITAAGTINNAAGTSTASSSVIVRWEKRARPMALALADAATNAAHVLLLNPYDLDDSQ